MRHYEIVVLFNPDKSEQVQSIIEHYSSIIVNSKGTIHRLEDWGRRQLAYPINKLHKAHYILLNIEVSQRVIDELTMNFRFNDAVIRSMIIRVKNAITEASSMIKIKEDRKEIQNNFINESGDNLNIISSKD